MHYQAQAIDRIQRVDNPANERAKTADTVASCSEPPRWKRALDLILILFTLPTWLTVMVLIAFWIKVTSPGPIFFKQERVGFQRRRFMMLKFRSMKVSAETQTHENYFDQLVQADCRMTKLDAVGDSRMIPGGRLLRASGLDELPQLFNVIFGEMSLVGPRPCTPRELKNYQESQHARFDAPPGLTGHWQVSGKNNTTFSEMVNLDIFYSRNMSLALDLRIMAKTVPTLLGQLREARGRAKNRAAITTAQAS